MLVYAIDFGTTHSLLAAADPEKKYSPIPLDPWSSDPTLLRTLLYFPNATQCFYGAQAIEEYMHHDLQGRLLRSMKKFLPSRHFVGTFIDQRPFNLEDLIGLFLKEMKQRADAYFKIEGKGVVLGRPARFSNDPTDDQYAEYRLKRAARMAGFEKIEFLPEPVAAAREFRTTLNQSQVLLVADLGGGTSDYTLLQVTQEPYQDSDVLAIGGVAVAGDALDGQIMRQKIAPHFGASVRYQVPFGSQILQMPPSLLHKLCSPAELSFLLKRDVFSFLKDVQKWSLTGEDRKAMDQLFLLLEEQLGFSVFEGIEHTKRLLSTQPTATFSFSYPGLNIEEPIKRTEFNDMIQAEVVAIMSALTDTLNRAKLQPEQVDLVCCTGGTAQVPAIQDYLIKLFGPQKVLGHHFFHSVVEGLTHRAQECAQQWS